MSKESSLLLFLCHTRWHPSFDNHMPVTTADGISNLPLKMVPVVNIDHAASVVTAKADAASLSNSVPVSVSIIVPGSTRIPGPETSIHGQRPCCAHDRC
ncbi:hypothetical protein BYT27DRAFT_6735005 [Phlegmacium glaucopus]|nr:hypothetical protein BYT27DRAFT_6735005 [Phlegmacium glaucopus]